MSATKAVLIVGGSGFVGTHLALKLRESYKVFATFHKHKVLIPGVTSVPGNVENRNWMKRLVYTARPDIIIYSAGPNNVVWAEDNNRDSDQIHTSGPATVLNVADILGPKFIYISNSYAFDGNRGNYHEEDTILPGTALGKSKAGGENFIRGRSLNYVIVRSSPLYGRGNGLNLSFLDKLRMELDRGRKIELNAIEIQSFGPVEKFAEFIVRIVDSGVRNKTLHYSGLTKLTWAEFGLEFAKRFGYDTTQIIAKRPPQKTSHDPTSLDYSLNCTQAVQMLKIKPLLLEEGFDLIQEQLVPRS